MPRGCSDWHGTRAALRGGGRPARADPGARARRPAGVRAQRRALAPQPAGGRRRPAARRQRPPRPLDARRARGGRGAGGRRARCADPRLALPRRRQRRAQHARAARRPALRGAALAHRRRSGDCAAARRHARASAGIRASPACASSTTRARSPCCPPSTTAHPDQSHFNSGGYWRSGIVGPAPDRTGWLGRTLDAVGTHDNPLQGIHVGWGQDPSLNGKRAPVATRVLALGFRLLHPGRLGREGLPPDLPPSLAGTRQAPGLAAVRSMYGNTIETHDRLAPLAKEDKPAPPPVAYPDTDLGKALGNLGRMLGAGFGTRIADGLERRLRHARRAGRGARRAAAGPRRLAARLAGRPRRARALASAC